MYEVKARPYKSCKNKNQSQLSNFGRETDEIEPRIESGASALSDILHGHDMSNEEGQDDDVGDNGGFQDEDLSPLGGHSNGRRR